MTAAQLSDEEWRSLSAAVKRVARARGLDPATTDDVAQETLTRLLAIRDRLEPTARLPYAITTAGNLIVSMHRKSDTARRHLHRLVDTSETSHPESDVLAMDEAAAVRSALDGLDISDRRMLVDHVEGSSTIDLAAVEGKSPGAIAAQLARTRARLRLDYLLALRHVQLPTRDCRPVLLAVSAADQRRQRALHAASHFDVCATCVDLLAPLSTRTSAMAGIAAAPLVALGTLGGRIGRAARSHVVQAASAAAAVAVGAGIYAAQPASKRPAPAAGSRPAVAAAVKPVAVSTVRTAAGVNLIPVPTVRALQARVGQTVIVRAAPVQSVVSHPGFWIGTAGNRLYVHLDNVDLIRQPIRAGHYVTFIAVLQRNSVNYAAADGVTTKEGAGVLTEQTVHLSADARAVQQS